MSPSSICEEIVEEVSCASVRADVKIACVDTVVKGYQMVRNHPNIFEKNVDTYSTVGSQKLDFLIVTE